MSVIGWSNDLQVRALERKLRLQERKRELAQERKSRGYSNQVKRMIGMSKRAALKGLGFDITPEWLEHKMSLKHCEATGLPFIGSGQDTFAMTIDRKDSKLGYLQENCWAVCWIYNRAKSDGTHEEIMVMARALIDKYAADYDQS